MIERSLSSEIEFCHAGSLSLNGDFELLIKPIKKPPSSKLMRGLQTTEQLARLCAANGQTQFSHVETSVRVYCCRIAGKRMRSLI
jgi:hypothetical protein